MYFLEIELEEHFLLFKLSGLFLEMSSDVLNIG